MRKILVVILIVLCMFICLVPYCCYAEDLGLGSLGDYKGTNPDSSNLQSKAGNILGAIQIIGTVLSVVMLIAIGIKYMLGSVEERAEYKKTLWPYIVGAFLLFTGTLIPQLIYDFMKNF